MDKYKLKYPHTKDNKQLLNLLEKGNRVLFEGEEYVVVQVIRTHIPGQETKIIIQKHG